MGPVLLSIGEILWDQYPAYRLLGGAPFNLAAHAARLGFQSFFISAVGNDEPGDEALAQAARLGVDMTYTRRHPSFPTGIVDVTLHDGHPSYPLRRPAAWEEPEITPCQAAAIAALRREAVDLALAGAGKLIGQKLDAAADRQLVEQYLTTLRPN